MEAAEVKNYRFICFTDAGRSLMMSLAEALHQREEGSGMEAPGSRRITDLTEAAEGYTTFTGASDNEDSRVRFIYKTDGIEA